MATTMNLTKKDVLEIIVRDPIASMDSMFSGDVQKIINLFHKFYGKKKRIETKENNSQN